MANYSENLVMAREKALGERVEFVASEMLPGNNYVLSLSRVKMSQFAIREFEQQFGRSLNRERGVDVDLTYDIAHNQFLVNRLTLGVDNGAQFARLMRTDTLGYIPMVSTADQKTEPGFLPLVEWTDAELLEKTGITQPPRNNQADYRLWRGELLGRTQGWQLDEHIDFIEAVNQDSTRLVRVSNNEKVTTDREEVQNERMRAVSRMIDVPFSETDHQYTESKIEVEGRGYDQIVRTLNALWRVDTSFEASVMGQPTDHTPDYEQLRLSEDTYNSFRTLIDFAVESIATLKDSQNEN